MVFEFRNANIADSAPVHFFTDRLDHNRVPYHLHIESLSIPLPFDGKGDGVAFFRVFSLNMVDVYKRQD